MNCVSHYTRTSAFINEKQNKKISSSSRNITQILVASSNIFIN